MEVATVASTRGKNNLIVNGYVYEKQQAFANNIVSYECERRRGGKCKAKGENIGELEAGLMKKHC